MSKNLLKLTGACLVLTGVAAMPLQASAQENNAVVARDAVTGKLRAATPEEASALEQIKSDRARYFRHARKDLQSRIHVSGGRGARMTDESMSASVAVIDANGKVEQECFESAADAVTAMSTGTLTHTHANLKPVSE